MEFTTGPSWMTRSLRPRRRDSIILRYTLLWSSADTPPWLVSELKAEGQTISLLDSGHIGTTYCEPIETCLYWNERYHSKRLALIAAAGEHYSADPDIVAVFASFANHNSQDWNIQDFVGDLPNCPNGDTTHVDQPKQWLDAGWTRAAMLQVGKDIADAVAAAFPTKCIKLPIGGLDVSLANTSPDPRGGAGNYSTLAYEITAYVYGDPTASPPIPAKLLCRSFLYPTQHGSRYLGRACSRSSCLLGGRLHKVHDLPAFPPIWSSDVEKCIHVHSRWLHAVPIAWESALHLDRGRDAGGNKCHGRLSH